MRARTTTRYLPRAVVVVAWALLSCALLGSCRSPGSLCEEWRQSVISAGLACTALSEEDLDRVTLLRDPLNVTRRGCGIVSTVTQPEELVGDCFPILNELTRQCGEGTIEEEFQPFLEEFPENLPAACSTGHFQTNR
jgi:hypothetical protein